MAFVSDTHWNAFYHSGKIEDYLRYKGSLTDQQEGTAEDADYTQGTGRAGTDGR